MNRFASSKVHPNFVRAKIGKESSKEVLHFVFQSSGNPLSQLLLTSLELKRIRPEDHTWETEDTLGDCKPSSLKYLKRKALRDNRISSDQRATSSSQSDHKIKAAIKFGRVQVNHWLKF